MQVQGCLQVIVCSRTEADIQKTCSELQDLGLDVQARMLSCQLNKPRNFLPVFICGFWNMYDRLIFTLQQVLHPVCYDLTLPLYDANKWHTLVSPPTNQECSPHCSGLTWEYTYHKESTQHNKAAFSYAGVCSRPNISGWLGWCCATGKTFIYIAAAITSCAIVKALFCSHMDCL